MKGILPEKSRLRRSKIGFAAPKEKWAENELRPRPVEFFSVPKLGAARYFNPTALIKLLNEPVLTNDETNLIWRILNLEIWYREFLM
jgi:hypothetical protein